AAEKVLTATIAQADQRMSSAQAMDLEALQPALQRHVADLQSVIQRRAALTQLGLGVKAYTEGNYERVVQVLPNDPSNGAISGRAALVRAAARYSLWVMGGQ